MADIQTLKAELEKELAEARRIKEELLAARPTGFSKDDLKEVLAAVAGPKDEPQAGLIGVMPNGMPEQAGVPRGPFEHPEGGGKYPKPHVLTKEGAPVEVFFGCKDIRTDTKGTLRLRHDDLSYVEAKALKELYESLAPGQRRVTRDGKWRVTVTEFGDQMHLLVPIKDPDDRQDLPGLLAIINELKTGTRTPNPADLAAQVALLEQKVAELSATQAQ